MSESRELTAAAGFLCRSVDRIIACLDGLDGDSLNWRPPASGANSLYAIATHAVANAEENVLRTLCGRPAVSVRGDGAHQREWSARADAADELRSHWSAVRAQIEVEVPKLAPAELERERQHPRRGTLTGRDILYVAARHAAEHQGQAELTRDLLAARRA